MDEESRLRKVKFSNSIAYIYAITNSFENYYSKHISKQIKFNEDSKTKVGLYKDSEEGNEILNPIVETNLTDNSYQNIHFCLDYPKLRKVFTKSLKGLERRCYKLFIKFNFTAREVAKAIGVSLRTAFNLKKSIIEKAKKLSG